MMNHFLQIINNKKFHIISWTCFILYETVFVRILLGVSQNPISYAVHYPVTIFLFYLYTEIGLEWVAQQKSYFWTKIILLIILWCTVYILLHYLVEKMLVVSAITADNPAYSDLRVYVLRSIYRGIYFLGFATGYYYLKTYLKEKKRSNELEKQKLEEEIRMQQVEKELIGAQNAFLQAQINPHFLFNTLDFVYHEVNTQSPKAGATIISLATMMRYALDAGQTGHEVFLQDEIAQVQELIYINQVRKHNELNLELKVGPEVQGLKIIPLVLLTLVENMFKHGDLQNKSYPASIQLFVKEELFYIQTTNLCNAASLSSTYQQGLANVEQRLKTSYAENAQFSYSTSTEKLFDTRLSISVERMR